MNKPSAMTSPRATHKQVRELVQSTGLRVDDIAVALGVSPRTIKAAMTDEALPSARPASYLLQYALEQLSGRRVREDGRVA